MNILKERVTKDDTIKIKDVCKASMKDVSTDPDRWEKMAGDRLLWRSIISKGTREFEKAQGDKKDYK